MKKQKNYTIKGIEKIFEKLSKRELAQYFGKSEDSDFTQDILQMLQERNIPSGMEIESFYRKVARNPRSIEKYIEYVEEIKNKRPPEDGRALIGLSLPFGGQNKLFIYVDEPIRDSDIDKMAINQIVGGVSTLNCFMGNNFYNVHADEIRRLNEMYVEKSSVDDVLDILQDGSPYNEDDIDNLLDNPTYEKEAKELIFSITGKDLNNLTLLELRDLKRKMQERIIESQNVFAEKYAQK